MLSVMITFGSILLAFSACAVTVALVWYAANDGIPWLRILAGFFALVVFAGLVTSMAYAISAPWESPCAISR